MAECLVCGSKVVKGKGRFDKKYCGAECRTIAKQSKEFFRNVSEENIQIPIHNPADLASKYVYASTKVFFLKEIMEERNWNVPDVERIIQGMDSPSLGDLEEE